MNQDEFHCFKTSADPSNSEQPKKTQITRLQEKVQGFRYLVSLSSYKLCISFRTIFNSCALKFLFFARFSSGVWIFSRLGFMKLWKVKLNHLSILRMFNNDFKYSLDFCGNLAFTFQFIFFETIFQFNIWASYVCTTNLFDIVVLQDINSELRNKRRSLDQILAHRMKKLYNILCLRVSLRFNTCWGKKFKLIDKNT